jgi:hypothetical protein
MKNREQDDASYQLFLKRQIFLTHRDIGHIWNIANIPMYPMSLCVKKIS